jgi:hypothetical protein
MRVFIPMALLLFGCVFAAGANAVEIVDESTSGGGISVPGTTPATEEEQGELPRPEESEVPMENTEALAPEEDLNTEDPDADVQDEQETSPVLNIVIPATVSISIDPFEINGRGQIYSDEYAIQNLTDSDVILTFTDMRVIFANDTDFEALAVPFDENTVSDRKAVQLVLNFGRNDVTPVVLTDMNRAAEKSVLLRAAEYDASEAASSLSLSFTGSLNHAPAVDWKDGDVKLRLEYLLEAVPLEAE